MVKDEPTLSQYRVASITEAVMAKYPALATWGEPLNGRILSP
jgi:phage tail protein X